MTERAANDTTEMEEREQADSFREPKETANCNHCGAPTLSRGAFTECSGGCQDSRHARDERLEKGQQNHTPGMERGGQMEDILHAQESESAQAKEAREEGEKKRWLNEKADARMAMSARDPIAKKGYYECARHNGSAHVFAPGGEEIFPGRSKKLRYHSGTFDWGEKNAGAKQLALAILLNRSNNPAFSANHYEEFCEDFPARAPNRTRLIITTGEMDKWTEAALGRDIQAQNAQLVAATASPPAPVRYMMGTRAYHLTGDISREKPSLCVIASEDKENFIGSWVTGFGFVEVKFPKSATRDLTPEEKEKYDGMHIAVGRSSVFTVHTNDPNQSETQRGEEITR